MKYVIYILIFIATSTAVFFSCAKWKVPKPYTDPQLTNPYCNDPNAVNYNWGFPGKPDSSLCFYPNSLFVGSFMYHDTMYNDTLFIGADSFIVNITIPGNSETAMTLSGLCGAGGATISLTGLPGYEATVDTTVGDTMTLSSGQLLCAQNDTISGYILRDRVDSPAVLHFYLQVVLGDSATISHYGSAVLIQ